MDEHDADVQRPEQRHVEQQRREVVVGDDGAVDREDEGLLAELRDVLQDAAQVGQLRQLDDSLVDISACGALPCVSRTVAWRYHNRVT